LLVMTSKRSSLRINLRAKEKCLFGKAQLTDSFR
jgi:hypothetical protein